MRLFTVVGITVRVHLLTVVYMLGQVLWSIPRSNGGIEFVAPSMLALFAIVLAHEFGHCIACRRWGGAADRIVMLPWGGLALTHPPNHWRAHFGTTAGGPAVNVMLLPVTSVGLWAAGMAQSILFNPLSPMATLATISASSDLAAVLKVTLWWFHAVNIIILGFNLLLPMYPFDGGRLVQSLLWRQLGFEQSMRVSVLVGYAGAMVLGVLALLLDKSMLVLIAVFGAVSCWTEHRRLRGEADLVSGEFPLPSPMVTETGPAVAAAAHKKAESGGNEEAELDRVLDKIAKEGKQSLSRAERKVLERATRKKRGE